MSDDLRTNVEKAEARLATARAMPRYDNEILECEVALLGARMGELSAHLSIIAQSLRKMAR